MLQEFYHKTFHCTFFDVAHVGLLSLTIFSAITKIRSILGLVVPSHANGLVTDQRTWKYDPAYFSSHLCHRQDLCQY